MSASITLRRGAVDDRSVIAALAIQVFLDTYATEGIRPDLGREALSEYGAEAFRRRLEEPDRRFLLAERAGALVGFAEVVTTPCPPPAGKGIGAELVRLYVQPAFQGQGVGRRLIGAAQHLAREAGLSMLWLTAWDGNVRARAFYERLGYADVGATTHCIEGQHYENRVLVMALTLPYRFP